MAVKIRLLTDEEFQELRQQTEPEYHKDQAIIRRRPVGLQPGMAWYMPWYYDPKKPNLRHHSGILSTFYWEDWSEIRPPLAIVCPNGWTWQVDGPANNCPGWRVIGEMPNISVSPSISCPGYHGLLTHGEFGPDLEGRGPNGINFKDVPQ